MSAGTFIRSRYQASYGGGTAIHPIRVQPETIAFDAGSDTNDPPSGAINNPISAKISLSSRGLGLRPRFVTIQLPSTSTPPTGYRAGSITKIPILTPGVFASLAPGDEVTYLGVPWSVVSTTAEEVK